MSYNKTTWVDNQTKILAKYLNNMESGIETSDKKLEGIPDTVENYVLNNLMKFKMDVIPSGKTFTIRPGMLGLVIPYGNKTLSSHKADGSNIITGMGVTMFFSAERDSENWGGDYWMALIYVATGTLGTTTVKSNHNKYSDNCYIKNNYSDTDSSTSDNAYVYYITSPTEE